MFVFLDDLIPVANTAVMNHSLPTQITAAGQVQQTISVFSNTTTHSTIVSLWI